MQTKRRRCSFASLKHTPNADVVEVTTEADTCVVPELLQRLAVAPRLHLVRKQLVRTGGDNEGCGGISPRERGAQ